MSQLTYPRAQVASRSHWVIALSALIALIATVVVILVVSIGGTATQVAPASEPVSGPSERNVAAAVGTRPAATPSESSIAAGLDTGAGQQSAGPDESRIASTLGR